MNTLQTALALRKEQQKGNAKPYPLLMTHVVLGYPTLQTSLDVVSAMEEGGSFAVELQIPFSDPMADGPTIMAANEAALELGVTPEKCLRAIEKLSRDVSVPLIIMSYVNILYRYKVRGAGNGFQRFFADAKKSGVSALIVPDIPLEESQEGYWERAAKLGLIPIPLVSPVSPDSRIRSITAGRTEGFVYCVSTTGTTGSRSDLPRNLPKYLQRVRRVTDLPLAVGFGISSKAHVKALAPYADIAIVGSAMLNLIKTTPKKKLLSTVRSFTKSLAFDNSSRKK